MNDEPEKNSTDESAEARPKLPVAISMVEFLKTIPPRDSTTLVRDALAKDNNRIVIATPAIDLHCASLTCNGARVYRYYDGFLYFGDKESANTYVTYLCSNC